MVRHDGVGDLLEDGSFTRARRSDDQTTGPFADGCDQVDDASLDQVRRGLKAVFLDRINRGQILEPHRSGVILERQVVDLGDVAKLRARATMRRLG